MKQQIQQIFKMDIKVGEQDLTITISKDEQGNYSSSVEKQ